MQFNLLSLFIFTFLLGGCKKNTGAVILPPPIKDGYTNLEEVWSKKLNPSQGVNYIGLYKNIVLYSIGDANYIYTVVAYNKLSGDSLWSWNDPGFLASGYFLYKDLLIGFINGNSNLFAIDLNNGKTKWSFTPDNANVANYAGLKLVGNDIYYACQFGGTDSTYLYKINPNNGFGYVSFKFSTAARNGFRPHILFADYWINADGDTILPLNIRGDKGITTENSSIAALNISKKDFYFDYRDTVKGETFLGDPVLIGNKVYYKGWNNNCRIDLSTKAIDYIKPIQEMLKTNSPIQYVGDKIISLSGNYSIASAYDMAGNFKWSVNMSPNCATLILYKGKIYTSGYKISCIDLSSGVLEWSTRPLPESWQYFSDNICIDQSNGYLYTSSSEAIHCFKIK